RLDGFDPLAGFGRIRVDVEQFAGEIIHGKFLARTLRAQSLIHSRRVRSASFALACALICASTHAIALMLTTRRTVACGVSTCAGLATPIRIGPITTPSASTRVMLNAVLAA